MSKIEKASIHAVGIVIGLILALIFSTWILSFRTVLEVTNNPTKMIEVVRGETFEYCRNPKYSIAVEMRLDKSLIKKSKLGGVPYSYPSYFADREKGFDKEICKTEYFPDVLEGDGIYIMKTYVSYSLYGWERKIELTDIYLNVKTKDSQ